MIYLLSASAFILVSFGLYKLITGILRLPTNKALNALKYIDGKPSSTEKLNKSIKPLAKLLSKLFPLSEYKLKKLQSDFNRLELKQSPQEFVSMAMSKSVLIVLSCSVFIAFGLPVFTLIIVVIALLMYFQSISTIKQKIQKLNGLIESEMPRFIETMNYSLDGNRDLISFVERYRSVAGIELGKELDVLLIDMKTGDEQTAIFNMDARLNIPSFTKLTAILCNVNQGIDKRQSLELLEQDVIARERESIRDRLSKQPRRIRISSVVLTLMMIVLFMVPIIVMIIENMQDVGF